MPISCRRVVKGVWRHWLQVPVGARHDEQCVCMWRASNISRCCPWRLVEAVTGFHCLRRSGIGCCGLCFFAGWAAEERG